MIPLPPQVTRISYYFPTRALTCFWICSNLIINDVNGCSVSQRQIVLALLILSSFIVVIAAFTDTYTATTGAKHWVLLVPYFGYVGVFPASLSGTPLE